MGSGHSAGRQRQCPGSGCYRQRGARRLLRRNNGSTKGTTTLPGVPLVENAFVAKMSAQGSWLWAVRSGNRSGRVALGAAGNVYCTGNFVGASAFGSFALTDNGL